MTAMTSQISNTIGRKSKNIRAARVARTLLQWFDLRNLKFPGQGEERVRHLNSPFQ